MTPVMMTCPNGSTNSAYQHLRGERAASFLRSFPRDLPGPSSKPVPYDSSGPSSKPAAPALVWRMRMLCGAADVYPSGAAVVYPRGAAEVKTR
jgi:hypothetical protein